MDQLVDKETMTSLGDPSVLLLKPAMSELQGTFDTMGNKGRRFLHRPFKPSELPCNPD